MTFIHWTTCLIIFFQAVNAVTPPPREAQPSTKASSNFLAQSVDCLHVWAIDEKEHLDRKTENRHHRVLEQSRCKTEQRRSCLPPSQRGNPCLGSPLPPDVGVMLRHGGGRAVGSNIPEDRRSHPAKGKNSCFSSSILKYVFYLNP